MPNTFFNNIDNIDKRIIEIIQNNKLISHKEIAKDLRITQPAVSYRIRNLHKNGILTPQTGINFKKVGIPLAFFEIQTSDVKKLKKRLTFCPFLVNYFKTLGNYNYKLLITAATLKDLKFVIDYCYQRDQTFKKINITIVENIRNDFILPVDFSILDFSKNQICPSRCPLNVNNYDSIKKKMNLESLIKIMSKHLEEILSKLKKFSKCDLMGILLTNKNNKKKYKYELWKANQTSLNDIYNFWMKKLCKKIISDKKIVYLEELLVNELITHASIDIFVKKHGKSRGTKYKKKQMRFCVNLEYPEFIIAPINTLNNKRYLGYILAFFKNTGSVSEKTKEVINDYGEFIGIIIEKALKKIREKIELQ